MEYDFEKNEKSSKATEPAIAYEIPRSSAEERIAYMKKHLHPTTVGYLEQWNFMVDRPFPYDDIDEHWMEESDDENPAISNEIVLHDREVWLHA